MSRHGSTLSRLPIASLPHASSCSGRPFLNLHRPLEPTPCVQTSAADEARQEQTRAPGATTSRSQVKSGQIWPPLACILPPWTLFQPPLLATLPFLANSHAATSSRSVALLRPLLFLQRTSRASARSA